jgi:hypothetical protein
MAECNELQIPDVAEQDPNSFELLRVWVANKNQHVSLRTGVWQDPAAWGIMLFDLMQHISNAYQQEQGLDRAETFRRILEGLNAELSSPTD